MATAKKAARKTPAKKTAKAAAPQAAPDTVADLSEAESESESTSESEPTSASKPKSKPKPKSTATATATSLDAIKLLIADHREVKALFQQYQEMVDDDADDEDKHPIAQQICLLLTVHAQIEEEIFYPAAEESIDEPDLVDEATVEHGSAKDLIAALQESDPSDDLFDARVKVLSEYIDHHVREEERQMFSQARKAKIDLQGLGEQLATRKAELMSEMGLDDDTRASAAEADEAAEVSEISEDDEAVAK